MGRIAEILLIEFASQIQLGNIFLPTSVASDYINAIDSADIPFVGVMYSDSDYASDYQAQSQAVSRYIIEIKGKGYPEARKISGVVRAILKDTQYHKLLFDAHFGFSGGKVLSRNMTIFEQRKVSQDDTTAYIVYEARHYETTERLEGVPLISNATKVIKDDQALYYTTNL